MFVKNRYNVDVNKPKSRSFCRLLQLICPSIRIYNIHEAHSKTSMDWLLILGKKLYCQRWSVCFFPEENQNYIFCWLKWLSEVELNLARMFRIESFPVNYNVTVFRSNKSLINVGWMPKMVILKINLKASAGIPCNKGFLLPFSENIWQCVLFGRLLGPPSQRHHSNCHLIEALFYFILNHFHASPIT